MRTLRLTDPARPRRHWPHQDGYVLVRRGGQPHWVSVQRLDDILDERATADFFEEMMAAHDLPLDRRYLADGKTGRVRVVPRHPRAPEHPTGTSAGDGRPDDEQLALVV